MEKFYDLYERYRDYIMSIILLFIIGGVAIFLYYYVNEKIYNLNDEIKNQKSIKIKEPEETIKKQYVDIKGEVKTPGVYSLDNNKRVIDAIKLAGGLTEKADTSVNNLSKKITDEMVIIIYSKKEVKNMSKTIENKLKASEKCIEKTPNNNSCLEQKDVSEKGLEEKKNNKASNSKTKITPVGKISINTATKEELMTLPGIGASKAEKIIEYRNKTKFNEISDIKNVKGIGDSIFEKIKDNITI